MDRPAHNSSAIGFVKPFHEWLHNHQLVSIWHETFNKTCDISELTPLGAAIDHVYIDPDELDDTNSVPEPQPKIEMASREERTT